MFRDSFKDTAGYQVPGKANWSNTNDFPSSLPPGK